MGQTVCQAVIDEPDLNLIAAVDVAVDGKPLSDFVSGADGLKVQKSLQQVLASERPDIAVDFTQADAALQNLQLLAENAVHAVVGTTGLSSEDVESLEKAFRNSNCILASNFSVSAVLMMKLAELAAPFFDSAEIVEMHHESKLDSPSGTAIETLNRIEAASKEWTPDPTQKETLKGARGAVSKSGIGVHSLRIKGMVAHQEVIFGAKAQSLKIRQDSYDRTSFMPGVIMAIKAVENRPGLTLGLDQLLAI